MGRSISVGLSLLGDGRVLRLTQRNMRTAISHLESTSTSSMRQIRDLISEVACSPGRTVSVVDRLLTHRCGTLTPSELAGVERVLNTGLMGGVLRLPPFEPEFSRGMVCRGPGGRSQRRGLGLFYNGVLFEIRQISVEEMLLGGPRDVMLEDFNGGLHFLRHLSVAASQKIVICSRYDLRKRECRPLPLDALAIYSVLHAQPTPGFHFVGCAEFLHGR
ncbi:MAG: hypothetical protein RL215_1138 [Planctomycetota bacterium]|jgi:hypothetical protein